MGCSSHTGGHTNQDVLQRFSDVCVWREKVRDRRRLLGFPDALEVVAYHEGRVNLGEEGVHDSDVRQQNLHVLHEALLWGGSERVEYQVTATEIKRFEEQRVTQRFSGPNKTCTGSR